MISGWLRYNARPLNMSLGNSVKNIETYADANGQAIYYIINLQSSGFVIASADDEIEPVISFVSGGKYDANDNNPMGALVSRDMLSRSIAVKNTNLGHNIAEKRQTAKKKWADLATTADSISPLNLSSVSDVRVRPLVQSKWDQSTVCSYHCYDYYTYFNSRHYYSGCVATAMAQLMRFHNYPSIGVGNGGHHIFVDGGMQTAYLRGGDGSGGPYNWTQMPLIPDCNTTETQRAAIGALCYDAGVAIYMDYRIGSSAASESDARAALVDTFHYSNAINGGDEVSNIRDRNAMINPNLDAELPVILGLGKSSGGGHAIVADGYGYNVSTLYHHLNMGWSGHDDAWYNLPDVNSSPSFNIVHSCVYNIYQTGSGEIISGRITRSLGFPVPGVKVTAQASGTPVYTATTNNQGIYALTKIMSNKTYTVSASKIGYDFLPATVPVGVSENFHYTSGNAWGVNFTDPSPHPPTAQDDTASAASGLQSTITLNAIDEGLPNPPGKLQYIITSLPQHGKLSDPCDGMIAAAQLPYTISNYGNNIIYLPCVYYTGADSFTFKANDSGTAPDGGNSDNAMININVQLPSLVTIYSADFTGGLPSGWSIVDGCSDGKTWTPTNPANRSNSNWSGTFMIVDSDWAGYVDMDEQLITANIDCSNYNQVKLGFSHYFFPYASEIADVDVRTSGGAWQNVARYQTASNSGAKQIDISAIGDHHADVQVRWHYYNANYAWFWGIDNISISGTPAFLPMPGDFGFNCGVDFDDLESLISAWLANSGDENWNAACDISNPADNIINFSDFSIFADNWLRSR